MTKYADKRSNHLSKGSEEQYNDHRYDTYNIKVSD